MIIQEYSNYNCQIKLTITTTEIQYSLGEAGL